MAALSFVIFVLSLLGSESGVAADSLAVINPYVAMYHR